MYINERHTTGMLDNLLVDIKLDKVACYRHLETAAIESACAEIEVAQLQEILKKYTSAEDTFTQQYLHGTNENIKLLVDMGKAVDAPETASDMFDKLRDREPLYFRCLVEVFRAWVNKTEHTPSPSEKKTAPSTTLAAVEDVLITDLKDQLNIP